MNKILFSLFISLPTFLSAQSISGDDIKAQFAKDWERSKAYTLDYLNTMPADKYSFKAVDSIRSFAQQMLHLASGTAFLMNMATGAQPSFNARGLEGRTTAQTKDSVVYYVTASYDYAIAAMKSVDASKLGEPVGQGDNKVSRYAWLLKALEHQAHHRGQTTIYIRLQGIRPPNERLF
ncbi:DinB family protein [Flavitalea sp. BT771]|uniref:DinB family protein n=1 Tax=Flavitalea sp. BT771 TaxID=3063329 RepID=UPI0026E31EF2|nr:DinB family protein [Flavitalea sp. BT771]MDO6432328.1 DinB family protein [Flavitalea sp. BT771]MDV6221238.1 DinB family protein [Flavitalea sp. BT771]